MNSFTTTGNSTGVLEKMIAELQLTVKKIFPPWRIVPSKTASQQKIQLPQKAYVFMIEKGESGKSIRVKAPDPSAAKAKLEQDFAGSKITFLWEWK